MTTAKHFLIFLLSAWLLSSCKTELKIEPMTDGEAIQYAKDLETKIRNGRLAKSESFLDQEVFALEVAKALSEKNQDAYIKEIKKALREKQLDKEFLKQIAADGSAYKFVRQYKEKDRHHMIFRYYSDEGLNYHDFELVKRNGQVRVADIYIYLSGEKMSKSLATIFNSFFENKASNKQVDEFAKNLTKMKSLFVRQKYKEAKELFASLPSNVRREKIFQIIHLQISAQMTNEIYMEAISEFEGLYGADPSAQLVMFDGYLMKEDFQKSLTALDHVDKAVQDPFLNYFRGLVYKQMEQEKTATPYFEKLCRDLPDFEDGVIELIANYIDTNQKAKATKLLEDFKHNTAFDQTKLENIRILYPGFASQVEE